MHTHRKSVLTHAEEYRKNVCDLPCRVIGPCSLSKTDNSAWDIEGYKSAIICLHFTGKLVLRIESYTASDWLIQDWNYI